MAPRVKKTWSKRQSDSLLESWECDGTIVGYDKGGNVYVWEDRRILHDKIVVFECHTTEAARAKLYEIMDPFSY